MLRPLMKIKKTNVYIVEYDMDGDDFIYLTTNTIDMSKDVSWNVQKVKKNLYDSNRRDLVYLCDIDINEEKIAIAMLTDNYMKAL